MIIKHFFLDLFDPSIKTGTMAILYHIYRIFKNTGSVT